MIENFVYDGVQVTKTGRTAVKKHPTKGHIIDTLVEINPTDPESFTWKKWVRENDLFKILDDNDPEVLSVVEFIACPVINNINDTGIIK